MKNFPPTLAAALSFGLFGIACSPAAQEQSPTEPQASATASPDAPSSSEERACQSDADCVVVETACCDHCNGGKADAFAKAFADQHKAKDCGSTACTERGCGKAIAVCTDHKCEAHIEPIAGP